MAEITQRRWQDVHGRRHSAWGFSFQAGGRQHKHYAEAWSRRDAVEALAARRRAVESPLSTKTFAEVVEEYVAYKRGKGKRSLFEDEKLLRKLQARLGGDTPIVEITAQRLAVYERERIAEPSRTGRPVKPATINRELSCLRHLLRLAEEWGYVE